MAALCKYWAFAFILCQLGQQHMLLNSIGSMGSFFLLGLGALLLLINSGRVFDRKTVSSSPFIYSFVFIFILYQFTFGIFDLNEKTGIYLIAKVVCCLMIALSVQKDLSFYLQRLMPILAAVTACSSFSALFTTMLFLRAATPWDSATQMGWEPSPHYAQEP